MGEDVPDSGAGPDPDRESDVDPDREPDVDPDRESDVDPDREPDVDPDRESDVDPDREPDVDPDRLREEFERSVGHWRDAYDDWLALDPVSFALFARFAAHPWSGDALSEREKALVQVALDAAVTNRNEAGLRTAIGHALDAGATVDEVREVLELTCGLGMHAVIEGLPEVQAATGDRPDGGTEAANEMERVRERFEEKRGYWSEFWEAVLEADHEYLDRYTDLSAHPWETGSLDPKVREFVYVAIDASTTHLYTAGLSTHVENAVEYGATREELVELLELVSLQGYDAMVDGVSILREESERRETGD